MLAGGVWLPEVEDQIGHHARLCGLSLWHIIEKQFTVRDHGERSLPALLHPSRLWDLNRDTSQVCRNAVQLIMGRFCVNGLTLTYPL